MRTEMPKQVLWILDYERYLDHGEGMTDKGRKWVELHKWQLDTPQKRLQLLHWYAPSDLDEDRRKNNGSKKRAKSVRSTKKPAAKKRRRKRKDKGLKLYMQFEMSWETTKRMGFTEKDEIQILKNYRNKGLPLEAISTITKIKRDDLIAKGVPA